MNEIFTATIMLLIGANAPDGYVKLPEEECLKIKKYMIVTASPYPICVFKIRRVVGYKLCSKPATPWVGEVCPIYDDEMVTVGSQR